MKWCVFEWGGTKYAGSLSERAIERIVKIDSLTCVNELIAQLHRGLKRESSLANEMAANSESPNLCDDFPGTLDLKQVKLLAPVPCPEKIICVGRNYAEHAAEMGSEVKSLPVIFSKFPTAIANPESDIQLPEVSEAVDFEAELVVVIGAQAKDVDQADAMQYVFGYCCGNDVSARDWQKGKPGGQWLLGKSFDSFAPIGPWITTREEVDHDNLEIRLLLNGNLMQSDNTSNLVFKVDYLVSHLSRFMTLKPGDLIFTGTPAGVGAGRVPPLFLKSGDVTVVEIQGLGKLDNRFVKA